MVLRTGKADTKQDAPAHTPGVKQGNSVGNYGKQNGHLPDGKRTDAASTGVNPGKHGPIDPAMPSLSPP